MDERIHCWQSHVTSIYRIIPAEGVVLHNYGIDRVAQLFGVNGLNGRIDPSTNGSEVECGMFAEELVTRYPLIVIKCNSLRGTIAGEGLSMGPAPQGPSSGLTLMESLVACTGNYSGRSRAGGRDPRSHLLLHQEGEWDTGPCPPQIYARIQKFVKH